MVRKAEKIALSGMEEGNFIKRVIMNRRKKIQLAVLGALFLILAAALAGLKIYEKNASKDADGEESYQVLQIDPSQVKEIGIINGSGTVNLVKEGERWKCLEEESADIDGESVEAFLEKASAITSDTKSEQVQDMAQYGLADAAVNVTLQWENNMYTVQLGDYNSITGSYYLRVNEQDTVYTADSSLYSFFGKSLEDFRAAGDLEDGSE